MAHQHCSFLLLLVAFLLLLPAFRSQGVGGGGGGTQQLNPSLRAAFIALQSWKAKITSDPLGITATWVGEDVCSYRGVFCSLPPDSKEPPSGRGSCEELVVSGIDLNHGLLSGTLPEELGLLTHLALFHINTNFFCGTLPASFAALTLLYELDISNNRFSGPFPFVTLALPSLAYLDLRFNLFWGPLPPALFERRLDAIFVNHNNFEGQIPWNLGQSPVSVANFASNHFTGAIPTSIGNMKTTLDEILFLNNTLDGCIPEEVGLLTRLAVFDASENSLGGELPATIAAMLGLEQLDIASNLLIGALPLGVCDLPRLRNLTFADNYFTAESPKCLLLPSRGAVLDDRRNCLAGRPLQRSDVQCQAVLSQLPSCFPLPPSKTIDPWSRAPSPPY